MKEVTVQIRCKALDHMSDFVKTLSPRTRKGLLPLCSRLLAESPSWRFRDEFCNQLILMCDLFDSASIYEYLYPLTLRLQVDSVAVIRYHTVEIVARLLRQFREDADIYNQHILSHLSRLAHSRSFQSRILYTKYCEALYAVVSEAEYDRYLLHPLLDLHEDKVTLVRLGVARVVGQHLCKRCT